MRDDRIFSERYRCKLCSERIGRCGCPGRYFIWYPDGCLMLSEEIYEK